MKLLLCLILLLASTVMVFAPKPPSVNAVWRLTKFTGNYYWVGADADPSQALAQIHYPSNYPADFPALLTKLLATNLTGKTLSIGVETITDGQPEYVFGGWITGWNTGSSRPHVRLFFTTDTGVYDNDNSSRWPNNYWWSHDGVVELDFLTGWGIYTLSANMNPSRWSNGSGGWGHNNPAAFSNALANCKQFGVAWGGGSFFDIGCIVTNNVATAFRLINYQILP